MPTSPPATRDAPASPSSSRDAVLAIVRDVEAACTALHRGIAQARDLHGDENAIYTALASLCDTSRYAELGVCRIADHYPADLSPVEREFIVMLCEGLMQRAAETMVGLIREGHLQGQQESRALEFTSHLLERTRRVSALRVDVAALRPLFTAPPAADVALPAFFPAFLR